MGLVFQRQVGRIQTRHRIAGGDCPAARNRAGQPQALLHAVMVARFEEVALQRYGPDPGFSSQQRQAKSSAAIRGCAQRTLNPVWSPDSKWVAYASRLNTLYRAIFASNVETGETRQVTDGLADAMAPAWDANGKYLWFLASTNFGLGSQWLDMTSYDREETFGLYFAVLKKGEPSPLLPESDEDAGVGSAPPNAPSGSGRGGRGANRLDLGQDRKERRARPPPTSRPRRQPARHARPSPCRLISMGCNSASSRCPACPSGHTAS